MSFQPALKFVVGTTALIGSVLYWKKKKYNRNKRLPLTTYVNGNISNLIYKFVGNGEFFNHDYELDPFKITYVDRTIRNLEFKSCPGCNDPGSNLWEHFVAVKAKYRCLIGLPLRSLHVREEISYIGSIALYAHDIDDYGAKHTVIINLKEPDTNYIEFSSISSIGPRSVSEYVADWRRRKYGQLPSDVEIYWNDRWRPLYQVFDAYSSSFIGNIHKPITIYE